MLMSFITVAPADPDCLACGGTGQVYERRPDQSSTGGYSTSIGPCGCRSLDNWPKVQLQCEHEFVCKKCHGAREVRP
jgi:hypothetical protein